MSKRVRVHNIKVLETICGRILSTESMCERNFGSIYPGFPVTKEGDHPLGEVFEKTAVIRGNSHDLSIRGLPLTPQSFRTWLYRAVPRAVRDIGGECLTLEVDAAARGKRPLPIETGETTVSHDSLAPTSPIRKKRFRKPRNVANQSFSAGRVMVAEEKNSTEKEDIPLSVRVTRLENRCAHLSRGIGKTFSSLRKLFQD